MRAFRDTKNKPIVLAQVPEANFYEVYGPCKSLVKALIGTSKMFLRIIKTLVLLDFHYLLLLHALLF